MNRRKNTPGRGNKDQSERGDKKPIRSGGKSKSYSEKGDKKSFRSDGKSKPYSEKGDKKSFRSDGKSKPFSERGEKKSYSGEGKSRPYAEKGKKYNPKSKFKITRKDGPKKPASDETRLNKYLAHAGIASRREADELIRTGLVSVNGEIITEMGHKVKPGDEVKYNGAKIHQETKRYVLLNKPKDYITTVSDDRGRNTVMNLLGKACKERIYPVGRLDRNTTGVLLFTNDGELAKKLTHPKHGIRKIYHVHLDQNLKQADFDKIKAGVTLEDGKVSVDEVSYVSGAKKNEVGLEIHIGRNRIVRRLFESLGYKVTKLDRVVFAGLTKKNLERGRWRFLTEQEVSTLKRLS